MSTAAYIVILLLLATASFFGIRWFFRAYSRYRGTRIVTCPETGEPAAVEVDALHAVLTSAVGAPDVRLEDCWRWPLKAQCGQECLIDLDVAPDECLVSGVLMRWYSGKYCVYCGKPFGEVHWMDHKPALQTPEGKLLQWPAVSIKDLSRVLETHLPVCWNCYIAQSFRLEHPDLVVYRPWRKGIPGGTDGPSVPRLP
jgi:hypothetical protein